MLGHRVWIPYALASPVHMHVPRTNTTLHHVSICVYHIWIRHSFASLFVCVYYVWVRQRCSFCVDTCTSHVNTAFSCITFTQVLRHVWRRSGVDAASLSPCITCSCLPWQLLDGHVDALALLVYMRGSLYAYLLILVYMRGMALLHMCDILMCTHGMALIHMGEMLLIYMCAVAWFWRGCLCAYI